MASTTQATGKPTAPPPPSQQQQKIVIAKRPIQEARAGAAIDLRANFIPVTKVKNRNRRKSQFFFIWEIK